MILSASQHSDRFIIKFVSFLIIFHLWMGLICVFLLFCFFRFTFIDCLFLYVRKTACVILFILVNYLYLFWLFYLKYEYLLLSSAQSLFRTYQCQNTSRRSYVLHLQPTNNALKLAVYIDCVYYLTFSNFKNWNANRFILNPKRIIKFQNVQENFVYQEICISLSK